MSLFLCSQEKHSQNASKSYSSKKHIVDYVTPVGNYAPDWAIAFNDGTVKHIFFIAETKGSMDSMQLNKEEDAKIGCAEKLFNDLSTSKVHYHKVDSYQTMLDILKAMD